MGDGRVSQDELVLLQLREASQGVEIWRRGQDASYASRVDHPTADVKGDLPADDASLDVGESQVRTIDLVMVR